MTTDDMIVQRYVNADGSLRQMPAKRSPRLLDLAHVARLNPVDVELTGISRRSAVPGSADPSKV